MDRILIILEEICLILLQNENHWHHLAQDYQCRYAFSGHYDHHCKHDYYERGHSCRRAAKLIKALLPHQNHMIELKQLGVRVQHILDDATPSLPDQRRIDLLIQKLV